MIENLERLLRRTRLLLIAVPFLLFAGWRVGMRTIRSIALPADATVHAAVDGTPLVTLEAFDRHLERIGEGGDLTEDVIEVYYGQIAPVEKSLRRRGVDRKVARRVAWPLVAHSARHELDVATVLAVLLIESRGYPRARSFVGARGLMQVMPAHVGIWAGCAGDDLYDIDTNLCYGTSILASNLRRFRGDERRALLAYNGCVRGENTPDCHLYPEKVARIRRGIVAEWGPREPQIAGAAAAP